MLLHPQDNCLISRSALDSGEMLLIDGERLPLVLARAQKSLAPGHKVARKSLNVGDKVLRYGAVIGTVTAQIAMGEHIHLHNLMSDYLPTHQRPL